MKIYQNQMHLDECWDLGLSDTTCFVTEAGSTGRIIVIEIFVNKWYKKTLEQKRKRIRESWRDKSVF